MDWEQQFWKQEVTFLKKVGPKRAQVLLAEADIRTYEDLILYFPRRYVDQSRLLKIREISPETEMVSLAGKLSAFETVGTNQTPRVTCRLKDETGWIELVWFQGGKFIQEKFRAGDEVLVYGKINWNGHKISIAHPEMELLRTEEDISTKLRILPMYPGTEVLKRNGLDTKTIRNLVAQVLEQGKLHIPEFLPASIREATGLPDRKTAIFAIHFPANFEQLRAAQERLKFDELFLFQLLLAQRRKLQFPQRQAPAFPKIGDFFNRFYKECLPFDLTNAQKRVVREIRADVAKTTQMNRLVQGDVGSGKTMVALLTMLMALDNGFQSAMLAPTEILAEQHYRNLTRFLEPLSVQIGLLTGSLKKKQKDAVIRDLQTGHLQILVGTHALLEDYVVFQNLGLTIIDEQHKFGVLQRAKLWDKANSSYPHNLVMTATPIPRTLAMTLYGDIDVSVIDELPPGRKEIKTYQMPEGRRKEVFGLMRREIAKGRQVYVVYPLVEESSKLDLLAVEHGFEAMSRAFPNQHIGIVHGKMKPEVKEFEMKRFQKNETQILVATTVIEVGVDIPNASVMVIENAERFGLSQLHQLRGRVGRGAEQSFCVLMSKDRLSPDAKVRLEAMVESADGFKIAETDLQLRGPGDFLGTRQSGLPDFKLANLSEDVELVSKAREVAFSLIADDPELEAPEHQSIRKEINQYMSKLQLQGIIP